MRLDKRQATVLLVAAGIIAAMMLFPPWRSQMDREPTAYAWIGSSPVDTHNPTSELYRQDFARAIDFARLGLQVGAVLVVAGAVVAYLRAPRD